MQELEFLGFLLNSSSMSVCLSPRKTTVKQPCDINRYNRASLLLGRLAQVGSLGCSLVSYTTDALIEWNKILALQTNKGDYDAPMRLSKEARSGMHWWIANFTTAFKDIMETNPVLTQDGGSLQRKDDWSVLKKNVLTSIT